MSNVMKLGYAPENSGVVEIPDIVEKKQIIPVEASELDLFNFEDFSKEPEEEIIEAEPEPIVPQQTVDEYFKEHYGDKLVEMKESAVKLAYEAARQPAYDTAYADAYEKAYEEAYEKAMDAYRGEIREAIGRVDTQLLAMEQLQNDYMESYARELKFLAIDVAEAMVLRRLEVQGDLLDRLILQTVDQVKSTPWLEVEVSEKLVDMVEELRRNLDKAGLGGRSQVVQKATNPGYCRVTTESGTIILDIETQAANLKALYRQLEDDEGLQ